MCKKVYKSARKHAKVQESMQKSNTVDELKLGICSNVLKGLRNFFGLQYISLLHIFRGCVECVYRSHSMDSLLHFQKLKNNQPTNLASRSRPDFSELWKLGCLKKIHLALGKHFCSCRPAGTLLFGEICKINKPYWNFFGVFHLSATMRLTIWVSNWRFPIRSHPTPAKIIILKDKCWGCSPCSQ